MDAFWKIHHVSFGGWGGANLAVWQFLISFQVQIRPAITGIKKVLPVLAVFFCFWLSFELV